MLHRIRLPIARAHSLARSGLPRLFGFGASILLLSAANLISIPAMITASGEEAWGAITLGQYVGTVGAVAVAYGWGWFGPARIAQYSTSERRTEYVESLLTRALLLLAIAPASGALAYILAPSASVFAAAGAVAMTSLGLSANWYFVGLASPYAMLMLETLPRVTGAAVGVALMYMGHSALMGPVGMFGGIIAATALSTLWIFRETRGSSVTAPQRRSIRAILVLNRDGVASALGASAFFAAPIAVVSVVAPGIQPEFAMADRVKGLIFYVAGPATTVLQGWVPRATGHLRVRRASIALIGTLLVAIVLGLCTLLAAPYLISWLGNGEITLELAVISLIAACVAVMLFQSVLERAVLATFERLRASAVGILAGCVFGVPLVAIGAVRYGVIGAMGGVLLGLVVCVSVEIMAYMKIVTSSRQGSNSFSTVEAE